MLSSTPAIQIQPFFREIAVTAPPGRRPCCGVSESGYSLRRDIIQVPSDSLAKAPGWYKCPPGRRGNYFHQVVLGHHPDRTVPGSMAASWPRTFFAREFSSPARSRFAQMPSRRRRCTSSMVFSACSAPPYTAAALCGKHRYHRSWKSISASCAAASRQSGIGGTPMAISAS